MGKSIDISISNIEEAEVKLKEEITTVNKLISKINQLPFGAQCLKSTGTCARTMSEITDNQIAKMASNLKELMEKTVDLFDDAKKKYQFMDNSLAEELKTK